MVRIRLTARVENTLTGVAGSSSSPFPVTLQNVAITTAADNEGGVTGDFALSSRIRYILVKQDGSVNTELYVNEVQVMVNGVNVALNKTVTHSGKPIHTGFNPSEIVDGQFGRTDGYASSQKSTDNWLQIDLGKTYYFVDSVKISALSSTDKRYAHSAAVFVSNQSMSGETYTRTDGTTGVLADAAFEVWETGDDATIYATETDDVISGRDGRSDTFVWNAGQSGTDTITNFETGDGGDKLNLRDLLSFSSNDDLADFIQVVDSGSGGNVTMNIDKDGGGDEFGSPDAVIHLEGIGTGALTLDDFSEYNIIAA